MTPILACSVSARARRRDDERQRPVLLQPPPPLLPPVRDDQDSAQRHKIAWVRRVRRQHAPPRRRVSSPVLSLGAAKAAKNSASGTDRRRCTWCCSAAPSPCRASTGGRCGRTGATRRTTSRCERATLAAILEGRIQGGPEMTPVFSSVTAPRLFTGTARPLESATTGPTGWSTSTPPGSSATTAPSSSRGRWTSAAEPSRTEIFRWPSRTCRFVTQQKPSRWNPGIPDPRYKSNTLMDI